MERLADVQQPNSDNLLSFFPFIERESRFIKAASSKDYRSGICSEMTKKSKVFSP
jgi:hypothetical protein